MASSMKQTIIKTIIAASGIRLCMAVVISADIILETDSNDTDGRIGNLTQNFVNGPDNVCNTPGCQRAASNILKKMDMSVKPCDDFYRFACGRFLNETVIPNNEHTVSTFTILDEKVQNQLRRILEEPSPPNEPKPFNDAKNWYKSCINNKRRKKRSLPKWRGCIEGVSLSYQSVGALYVEKYSNEDVDRHAAELVDNIKAQFSKILQETDWMDNKTKQYAFDKAASISKDMTAPDELHIALVSSSMELRKLVNQDDYSKYASAAEVDAYYSPYRNSIQLPTAILQDDLFSSDRPSYMDYGGIGMIVGHEITHGFDTEGRKYDKKGNLFNWWTPSTEEKYLAKTQCIINQYGNYTVKEAGLNVNGNQTLDENIGDNGGFKVAYLAYKDWSDRNGPEPMLPNLPYTPRQMFWISAASIWCSVSRPWAIKSFMKYNNHSPSEFRVIGSLSNMPEFAEDFECPVGSKMNPEYKCSVW